MKLKITVLTIIAIMSLAFGIGRFYVPGHAATIPGTYEAFAHIWIGILLVYGMKETRWFYKHLKKMTPNPPPITNGFAVLSGFIITAIEAYMFIHQGWFEATF
jgi:hypothetical protein